MRGVIVCILLLSVLLVSCEEQAETGFLDVSEFNKVNIIDFPYEELDAKEVESLHAVYLNEQKAAALYTKILDLFEGEQPFSNVLFQQGYQLALIEEVYAKYQLVPPSENFYANVTRFSDPEDACGASLVFAEESILFYEEWLDNQGLKYKVDNQDLRFLYQKLRDDYELRLVPAFKRCGRGIR